MQSIFKFSIFLMIFVHFENVSSSERNDWSDPKTTGILNLQQRRENFNCLRQTMLNRESLSLDKRFRPDLSGQDLEDLENKREALLLKQAIELNGKALAQN
jgi:hypothetical protein